jgi:hypothetical protein
MSALETLWLIFDWLPRVFALDLLAFHLLADHPLAVRQWIGCKGGPDGS